MQRQKTLIYREAIRMLKAGEPIKKITEITCVMRLAIYRVKSELARKYDDRLRISLTGQFIFHLFIEFECDFILDP